MEENSFVRLENFGVQRSHLATLAEAAVAARDGLNKF